MDKGQSRGDYAIKIEDMELRMDARSEQLERDLAEMECGIQAKKDGSEKPTSQSIQEQITMRQRLRQTTSLIQESENVLSDTLMLKKMKTDGRSERYKKFLEERREKDKSASLPKKQNETSADPLEIGVKSESPSGKETFCKATPSTNLEPMEDETCTANLPNLGQNHDIKSVIRSLWVNQEYTDVRITTADCPSPVHCHSAVLGIASPYIKKLLVQSKVEERELIYIHIDGFSHEVIRAFVQRLYCFEDSNDVSPFPKKMLDLVGFLRATDTFRTSTSNAKESSQKEKPSRDGGEKAESLRRKKINAIMASMDKTAAGDAKKPRTLIAPVKQEKRTYAQMIKDQIENEWDSFSKPKSKQKNLTKPVHYNDYKKLPKKVDCQVPLPLFHDRYMLNKIFNQKQKFEQYILHKLPGFDDPDKLSKMSSEPLMHALFKHFKVDHGHESPTMLCRNCCKRLTCEDKSDLHRHIKKDSKGNRVVHQFCKACMKDPNRMAEAPSDEAFEEHQEKAGLIVNCNMCKEKYYNFVGQQPHVCETFVKPEPEEGSGKKNWPVLCTECGHSSRSKEEYEGHLNKHSGLTPYHCDFEGCDFKAEGKHNLRSHQKMHTKAPRCSRCMEPLTEYHEAEHHDPSLEFGCQSCDYRADSDEKIREHHKRIHDDMIQCPKCVMRVFSAWIKRHDRQCHSPDLPIGCPHCGYRCQKKMGLAKHIAQWHAEKPFPCRLGCTKSFLRGCDRNGHEKNHCIYSEGFKQRMGDLKHRNKP